jgi:hypothetical protein
MALSPSRAPSRRLLGVMHSICYVKIKSFVEKNVFAQKKWKFVLAGECFSLPKAQRQE